MTVVLNSRNPAGTSDAVHPPFKKEIKKNDTSKWSQEASVVPWWVLGLGSRRYGIENSDWCVATKKLSEQGGREQHAPPGPRTNHEFDRSVPSLGPTFDPSTGPSSSPSVSSSVLAAPSSGPRPRHLRLNPLRRL